MKNLTLFILSIYCFGIASQNLTFEKLNSEKINFAILFRLEKLDAKKRLTYEIDPRDEALKERNTARSKIIHPETKKLALASTSNCFNILFDFYNPLRYRYKISSAEKIDPSTEAFEKFYTSVFDVAKKLHPSIDGISSSNESVASTISNVREFSNFEIYQRFDNSTDDSRKKTDTKEFSPEYQKIRSDELIDWVLWYFETYKIEAIKSSSSKGTDFQNKEAIDTLFARYIKIESYLYDKINAGLSEELTSVKDAKLFYESFLMSMLEDLSKKSTAKTFQEEMEKIYKNLKRLTKLNSDIKEICDLVEKMPFISTKSETQENYFTRYTEIKRTTYLQKARGILNYRISLIEKFEELLNDISDKFIPSLATESTTKAFVQPTEFGKINEINVQLIESDFEIVNGKLNRKEDKTYNFDLMVSEYSSFIAEFGIGSIFFSQVHSDTYTSNDGIIVKASDKRFFSPLASLNIIPNIGRGQAFWLLQIGVGTNIDIPVVAIGTGVRIYNVRENVFKNFALTCGVTSCFIKQLRKYSVGDLASQDEIENDVFYSPVFRPYIGIQINLD